MQKTLTMHIHIEWNPVLTFWWDVDGGIPRPGSHGQQEEREQKSSASPPAAHLLLWCGRHCTCLQAQHNGQENLWLSQSEKGNRHGFFFLYVSLRFTPSWCTLTAREERERERERESERVREGGAGGEAHVWREKPFRPPHGPGQREPERRETKDRVTGRGRERGGVGGTVKTRGAYIVYILWAYRRANSRAWC